MGLSSIVWITFYYCFSEWLFTATRLSFLGPLPWTQKASIGILAFLSCLTFTLLVTVAVALAAWILGTLSHRHAAIFPRIVIRFSAAVILASAFFMTLNNFSYTTMGIGVYNSAGVWKKLFAVLFLALLPVSYVLVARFEASIREHQIKAYWTTSFLLCAFAAWHTGALAFGRSPLPWLLTTNDSANVQRPNILIVGSDAVSADLLSLYGFEKPTTPFLDAIAGDSLIFDNALPNVNESSGSILTLLSGKSPASTRVLTYPDILAPAHSYQHLPLILRQLGYETMELSIRNWADSFDLNAREAFDRGNGRDFTRAPYRWLSHYPAFYSSYEFYLLCEIVQRIQQSILLAFDPDAGAFTFSQVEYEGFSYDADLERIETMLARLRTAPGPLFAHLHLMGTHGPKYETRHKTFPGEGAQSSQEGPGLFDAILDFDSLIQKVIDELRATGRLENTIIVVYSDHGHHYGPLERVPLLFRFPKAKPTGRIKSSVQLADVAPTLLSYMQVPIPAWMEGKSLLTTEGLEPARTLFSSSTIFPFNGQLAIDPVFYTLVSVQAFTCNQYLALDIQKRCINVGTIPGHSLLCPSSGDANKMAGNLLDYLNSHDFDTMSVRAALVEPDTHRCREP